VWLENPPDKTLLHSLFKSFKFSIPGTCTAFPLIDTCKLLYQMPRQIVFSEFYTCCYTWERCRCTNHNCTCRFICTQNKSDRVSWIYWCV